MKVEDIIENARTRYKQCKSYADTGHVEISKESEAPVIIRFKTYFGRPSNFRFEWQDYGPNRGLSNDYSFLCSDKNKTFMHRKTSSTDEETTPELATALSTATGCSAGAANVIPSVLFEKSGNTLELTQLVEMETQKSGNHECYLIQGASSPTMVTILMISVDDFCIRRVERRSSISRQQLRTIYDDFMAREEVLATKLGRTNLSIDKSTHYKNTTLTTSYSFDTVEFDKVLPPTLFRNPLP